MDDSRVERVLTDLLKDEDAQVRETAVKGLHQDEVALKMLKDPHPQVRRTAIEQLHHSGRQDIETEIIGVLEDEDQWVQSFALIILNKMKQERFVPIFARYMVDEHWRVVDCALQGLVEIGTKEALLALLAYPVSIHTFIGHHAIRMKIITSEWTCNWQQIIVEALYDPNPFIRASAAYCVSSTFIDTWIKENNQMAGLPIFFSAAVSNLLSRVMIHETMIMNRLIELLDDEYPRVRECTVGALGTYEASQVVPHLVKKFQDVNLDVRDETLRCLIRIGKAATLPLIHALDEYDAETRWFIAQALKQIDAEDLETLLQDSPYQKEVWAVIHGRAYQVNYRLYWDAIAEYRQGKLKTDREEERSLLSRWINVWFAKPCMKCGRPWWQLTWVYCQQNPDHRRFRVGHLEWGWVTICDRCNLMVDFISLGEMYAD